MDKTMMFSVLLCVVALHFTAAAGHKHAADKGCPYGWTFRSGACYRVVKTDTPKWEHAEAKCRAYGARLVKITSKEENEFVVELAKKWAPTRGKLWIGMERDCDDNKFYWQDGTNLKYSNWLEGQPDNFDGKENCGHLYLTKKAGAENRVGKWNDRPCNSPNESIGFMCQKECSSGWSYFNGDCYRVETQNAGWRDAVQKCAKQGAELVDIKYEEKNTWLTSLGAKFAPGRKRMWIAMHRCCDGELRWTDGTKPRYTNWRKGQPDNFDKKENCVHSYLEGDHKGKWNDMPCILKDPTQAGFACQKDDRRLARFRKGKK